jgi:6-phosphogluconate dehydrogenase
MLMREAAKVNNWDLNNAGIAAMWRGGCIIKSVFLSDITAAYRENPQLENLLTSPFFLKALATAQPGWRRVVAQSVLWGIPVPAHTTALSFFDGYRTETLPANLIQAQRDYFGAHTFRVRPGQENERLKSGEDIHVKWTATSGNVSWRARLERSERRARPSVAGLERARRKASREGWIVVEPR